MIELVFTSFFAGVLTVAAPCILPLLPVILGASVDYDHKESARRSFARPLIIICSLAVSIFVFTLLLKASTYLLGVPDAIWHIIAGMILILFGISTLLPSAWEKLMIASNLQTVSNRLLFSSQGKNDTASSIALGAALGPVFNSCSPTYALIVATILPASLGLGLMYLTSYVLGLVSILLLITLLGQKLTRKLGWLITPNGWFRTFVGIIFIVIGVGIVFSIDKQIQTFVLENGWYDPIMRLEQTFSE